jgi:hypothetical protein
MWALTLSSLFSGNAFAQDAAKSLFNSADVEAISKSRPDFAAPRSPAFAILGVSPDSVSVPGTSRDLVADIISGTDENGNFQAGLAIDSRPFILLQPSYTLAQYKDETWRRIISNTSLSFATVKGQESGDKSIRASIGLKFTPYDSGDPLLDEAYKSCLTQELGDAYLALDAALISQWDDLDLKKTNAEENARRARASGDRAAEQKSIADKREAEKQIESLKVTARAAAQGPLGKKLEACGKNPDYAMNAWNPTAVSFGIAPLFISKTGSVDDIRMKGFGVWGSASWGFSGIPVLEKYGLLIGQVQYRGSELQPDPVTSGQYIQQNKLIAGGQIKIGSPDLNISIGGSYNQAKPKGMARDSYYTFIAGADIHLSTYLPAVGDGKWLSIAYATNSNRKLGKNDSRLLASVKFALGSKAFFE